MQSSEVEFVPQHSLHRLDVEENIASWPMK